MKTPQAARAIGGPHAQILAAYERRDRLGIRHSWFAAGHRFQVQDRERRVLTMLARHGKDALGELDILEVGCGTGAWLRKLVEWGATPGRLTAIDLRASVVAVARERTARLVRLAGAAADALPFRSESFDVLVQATVFSSVRDRAMRRMMAGEMLRVLRRGGFILWYDLRVANPRNADVSRIGSREIRHLFAECRITLESATLAPPLARAVAPCSWIGAHLLAMTPWLRTHYLGLIQRRSAE